VQRRDTPLSKPQLLIIVLQVARADYWFHACLFSADDVFRSSFPLRWIRRHEIAQRPNATRVCQCRFRVGGLRRVEIARFQSAIRFRRAHPAEDSPRTCLSHLFFWWAESSFLRREYLATRWGVSYSELNALVCRAVLVRLSPHVAQSVASRQTGIVARHRCGCGNRSRDS
jgi:hypothetical protein